MPVSFRPNAKVWIWLESDKDIEASSRPMFRARVLTCEQCDQWAERASEIATGKGTYDDLLQGLLEYIDDWKNFPEAFSVVAIRKYLTRKEVLELTYGLAGKVGAQEDELKNSDSPSQSNGAVSAPSAAAGNAADESANANPS